MNLEETAKIINILQLNYPDSFKGKDDEETVSTVKLWNAVLAGEGYQEVQAAVLAHMATDTSRFMPPVGAIKQKLVAMREQESMTEADAWNLVMDAIRRSAYYSDAEYEKLPDVCKKIVGSPRQLQEWAIDENLNISVVQSNFMRSYRTYEQRQKEIAALPPAAKKVFGITEQLAKMIKG